MDIRGRQRQYGIRTVARAEPDGYTLLMTFSGYQVTNPSLFKKLEWDPLKSFVPVGLVAKAPFLIIEEDLPASTLPELAYAKEREARRTHLCLLGPGLAPISAPSCSSSSPGPRWCTCPTRVPP